MKKLISVVSIVLVLALSLSLCAYAASSVKFTLSGGKVYAGDEFTVNLYVSDNSKISGAVIDIHYDKSKLQFISAEPGGILDSQANTSIKNIDGDDAYVRFAYMAPSSEITAEGILLSVTFKALDSASGIASLSLSVPSAGDLVSSDLSRLSYTVENSEITVVGTGVQQNGEESSSQTESGTESETQSSSGTAESSGSQTQNESEENKNDNTYKIIVAAAVAVGVIILAAGILIAVKYGRRGKKNEEHNN